MCGELPAAGREEDQGRDAALKRGRPIDGRASLPGAFMQALRMDGLFCRKRGNGGFGLESLKQGLRKL
jgi:hypothetical protein